MALPGRTIPAVWRAKDVPEHPGIDDRPEGDVKAETDLRRVVRPLAFTIAKTALRR
jgi:hypothetical protein